MLVRLERLKDAVLVTGATLSLIGAAICYRGMSERTKEMFEESVTTTLRNAVDAAVAEDGSTKEESSDDAARSGGPGMAGRVGTRYPC